MSSRKFVREGVERFEPLVSSNGGTKQLQRTDLAPSSSPRKTLGYVKRREQALPYSWKIPCTAGQQSPKIGPTADPHGPQILRVLLEGIER